MAVKYYTEESSFRLPEKGLTARWLKAAAEAEGFKLGAINYVFCSSARMREVNNQFLGHDYFTDVITFDYTDYDKHHASGDIFIDPETVADNARKFGTDPSEEIYRVVVHGVMHLCGYKDKTPETEKVMHAKEDKYLALRNSMRKTSKK